MGHKNHKKYRDRHKLIMRRLRKKRIFPGHPEFQEEHLERCKLMFSSQYSRRKGVRFVRNRFHRYWRRQGHQLERAVLLEDEQAFDRINPFALRGAIWWLID